MTQFDERERAFEAKFAHDEEMIFRAESRAAWLTGLWAAGLLGRHGAAAEAYARDLIRDDVKHAGHVDVIRHLAEDLGPLAGTIEIRERLDRFRRQAKGELYAES